MSQRFDGTKTVVELVANVQEFSAGEPFGAFVRRDVRLETDSSDLPQFVVPITGWLDINSTPRDFNQFVFRGQTRWRGIWSTPNIAGALLAILALFLIGVVGWFGKGVGRSFHWLKVLGLCLSIIGTAVSLCLLGLTYSRGAWFAFLVSNGIMAVCCPALRKVALVTIVTFLGITFLLPSGVQRMESYTRIDGDLSIANRLKLWEGSLQMMAEHPLTGVGSGQLETAFERDYQSYYHTAKTSTAVNDFLTLGSEHGTLVLSLLLGPLLLLLTLSLQISFRTECLPQTTLTAILVAILTTSSFSTLWVVPEYRWLSLTTVAGLLFYITATAIRETGVDTTPNLLLQVSKWSLATLVVLILASAASLALLPTRTYVQQVRFGSQDTLDYRVVQPRWAKSRGTILYLTDTNDEVVLSHSTLRPMAAMGWQVISLSTSTDPIKLRRLVAAVHQASPGSNIFVAGDSSGGKLAWKLAAGESPDVIKAGGGFNFLSMDLDAPVGTDTPHQPFLVYQSLYAEGISSNPAICARNQAAFKDVPLTIILSPDEVNHFSIGWMKFLTSLSTFFASESSRNRS